MKFVRATDADGSTWGAFQTLDNPVGPESSGQYASLAIIEGAPAISYSGDSSALKYIKSLDQSGTSWGVPETVDETQAAHSSLGALGNGAIAYHRSSGGALKFARLNSTPTPTPTCTPLPVPDFLLEIENPEPFVTDRFGLSIAPFGDDLIVGVQLDDFLMTDSGSAYLMDGSTGALLQTFRNPMPGLDDRFGSDVVAVGTNILISAYSNDGTNANEGSAYLFDGTSGDLLLTINNPFPLFQESFGFCVASHGMLMLIGESGDDSNSPNGGALHIYDGDPSSPGFGERLRTLTIPGAPASATLGSSACVVGGHILVGAPGEDVPLSESGAAYLFNGDVASSDFGNFIHRFENPTPAADDHFGRSVAEIDGRYALISSYADDTAGLDAGAVYLFDADPASPTFGELIHTFVSPDAAPGDQFGFSITSGDNLAVVGAMKADGCGEDEGALTVFDASPASPAFGDLIRTWRIPYPQAGDELGRGITAANGRVYAGASLRDSGALDAGSVFVFQIPASGTPTPTPPPNAAGDWDIYR